MHPRFAIICLCPLDQRAQGRPGARCTRGLVCKLCIKKRTRAYRSSGGIRLSLRSGLRLIRTLPGDQDLLVTVIGELLRRLHANLEASGPHDFAIRFRRPRQERHPRPPHPRPALVTLRTPL